MFLFLQAAVLRLKNHDNPEAGAGKQGEHNYRQRHGLEATEMTEDVVKWNGTR